MTGGGNQGKIKTAHKTLIWAVVGLAIALADNGITAVIENILEAKRWQLLIRV